jgi:toxin FitB
VFLVDTDAISLTSPESRLDIAPATRWRAWVVANGSKFRFSAVTILEIRYGIERARGRGAVRKAGSLEAWLRDLVVGHADRVVPVSIDIASAAGVALGRAHGAGAGPSIQDAIIAATAMEHGLVLVTRNLAHMRALGADCRDPFDLAAAPNDGG